MAWLPLIASWTAILIAAGLRYREVGLRHAAPLPLSSIQWIAVTAVSLGVLAAIVLSRWRHHMQTPAARRACFELTIFPFLFFMVWAWLPSGERQTIHLAAGWILLVGIAWLLLRDPGWRAVAGSARDFDAARRALLFPTLLMMAPALVLYFRNPVSVDAQRVLRSLVTYPIYAFVQLAIFLVFAQTRLRRLEASSLALVAVPAGLFSLLHWPNAPLMLATVVAMAVWAAIELRHPSLFAMAISMAVLATVTTQFLPENITSHLRVGPGYVFHAHLGELYDEQAALEDRCVQDAFYQAAGGSIAGYSRALFDTILQEQGTPEALTAFTRQWELEWHARVSAEFERARMKEDGLKVDESACVRRGQKWAADWLDEEASRGAGQSEAETEADSLAPGGNASTTQTWANYVAKLYREVLGREGSAQEIESWSPIPPTSFRRAMIHAAFKEPAFFRRPGTAAAKLKYLDPLISWP